VYAAAKEPSLKIADRVRPLTSIAGWPLIVSGLPLASNDVDNRWSDRRHSKATRRTIPLSYLS